MASLADIVFDCHHPASLARFWAATIDGYQVAPYDDAEHQRLAALGVHDIEDDPTVLVEGPDRAPRLWFQRMPEPKAGKNRVHLDVMADDVEAEVARLVSRGAAAVGGPFADGHRLLIDPEGNELCVVGRPTAEPDEATG